MMKNIHQLLQIIVWYAQKTAYSPLLPDGEVYWQTTMENFGFSHFNIYPEEYDMVFNVGLHRELC